MHLLVLRKKDEKKKNENWKLDYRELCDFVDTALKIL